jgi:hypothetical protein
MSLRLRAHAPAVLSAFAATALIAAGCGGSDTPGGEKTAFIRSADRVCRDASQIGQAMSQQLTQALQQGNTAGAAQAINLLQPTYRKHLDRLAALQAPAGEQAKVKEVVDALNQAADDVATEARALQGNDQKLLDRVVGSLREKQARARKLAVAYGFKVCGSA